MSTTIDQKVVEMRFDNKHFEKNVSGTMSTLDKLKEKLNLSGASKGLDNIGASAKRVDMTGLSRGVETVTAKFSALQVIGVTALSNLTNSVVNYGKNITRALTIAPVTDGFQEYEMTLNAVQTTMAGTGKTAAEVEKELKKLDEYADKTVYSTADMLNNLPKFTNAGVELESATKAMIGIANATALAGGDAGKASIAFYNLGQAIGTGYLTRMDYNSINNAGIATMEWKNQMVEAAIAQGTLTKVGEDAYKAGNKTLTLQQLFIEGLQEQWATTDVMMKVFGDYGDETTEVGKKAYSAAQDIKTYSMMMDSLKATAGTGWKDTWQIIFGNLDQAKEFWTGLTNAISGVITKMADIRNNFLNAVLNFASPWTDITDKLGNVKEAVKSIEKVTDKIEYFQKVVKDVWRGDYKNSDTGRFELLEKAGYDHRVIQDLVNKGRDYKLTIEDIEASHKKFGLTMETTTEETKEITKAINNLSEEQLKEAGLTEFEIRLYKDLQREAERTGKSVSELADEMSKTSGRTLIINSFKNIGESLVNVFRAMGEAWKEIFEPVSIVRVYSVLKAFEELTESFKKSFGVYDETTGEFIRLSERGEKLKRTFKGLFAAIDIVTTLVGGGFKIAFKVITSILSYFNLDLLDVTAIIGDALVKFRDWMDSVLDVSGALEVIIPFIGKVIKAVGEWIKQLKSLPAVSKAIGKIKEAFKSLKDINLKDVGNFIFDGLLKGLGEGALNVIKFIGNVAKDLIAKFCEVTGIASPSKVFIALGGFIIAGLISGISDGAISVPKSLKAIVDKCIEVIKGIDWGTIFAIGASVASLWFLKKMGDMFGGLASMFDGIGDILSETSKVVKSFGKVTNAIAMEIKTKALKNLAVSLAILVGCIVAIVKICGDDYGKMWHAVLIIGVLAGILVALAWATGKMSDASVDIGKGGAKISGLKQGLLGIAAAIAILGITVKMLGSMKPEQYTQGMLGVVAILGMFVLITAISEKLIKQGSKIAGLGVMLQKMAVSMLLLAVVAKILGGMSEPEMIKAGIALGVFVGIIALLTWISMIPGKNMDQLGDMLQKMAVSMLLMAVVVKIMGGLSEDEMKKAAAGLGAFLIVVLGLTLISLIPGKNMDKLGTMLLGMAGAMVLLAIVVKILGTMTWPAIGAAAVGLVLLTVVIAGLVAITKLAGNDAPKIAVTLLAMAAAIGILALVATLLGLVPLDMLAKGVGAIAILGVVMALMIQSTRFAEDVKGNLIAMTAAIAIMALAVAGLSFIDPVKLYNAVGAMAILMGMFALIIKSSKNVTKSMGTLIVMTIAIAALAGVVWLLSKLDPKSSIGNVLALSVLLVAATALMVILSKIKMNIGNALKGILGLTAMAAPMFLFALVLKQMDGINNAMKNIKAMTVLMAIMTVLVAAISKVKISIKNAIVGILGLTAMAAPMALFAEILKGMDGLSKAMDNTKALTALMAAMSVCLAIVSVIGQFLGAGALVGILSLTAMAIPMLAFIGVLALMNKISNATENANLIIGLMTVITDMLVKISLVAPLAVIGVAALTGLIAVMGVVGLLAVALGALTEKFPSIQSFLDTGISLLIQLAGGLGEMIGAFVSSLLTTISGALPQIGMDLSMFMLNATAFIAGARTIDDSVLNGVKTLSLAILALCAAELISGIADFISLGNMSFADLGSDLSAFMENCSGFIEKAGDIDPSIATAAKTLAETILILTGAELLNNILNFGQQGDTLSSFGGELESFGESMNAFSKAVSADGGIDSVAVESAANAGKMMAELQASLVGTGGVVQFFTGEKNLADFGTQLLSFGGAIVGFSNYLKAYGPIDMKSVEDAANAGKLMTELQKTLVPTGGVLQFFTGDKDFLTFGNQLASYARSIISFSNYLKIYGPIDMESVENAANAGSLMSELQKSLDASGGVIDYFTGDKNLAKFGLQLKAYGASLVDFSTTVTGNINSDSIQAAADAGSMMSELQKSLPSDKWLDGKQNLEQFGEKVEAFGGSMATYSEKVADINVTAVDASVNAATSIGALAKTVAGVDKDALSSFNIQRIGESIQEYSDAVKDINYEIIDRSIDTARRLISLTKAMRDVNSDGINNFRKAMNNLGSINLDNIGQTFDESAERIASIGIKIVQFINSGITENQDVIIKTTTNIISKIYETITAKQDSFVETGANVVKGFAQGILKQSSVIYTALTTAITAALVSARNQYFNFYNAGSHLVSGFANGIDANAYKAAASARAMAKAAKLAAEEALGIASPSKEFYKIGNFSGLGFVNALGDYATKAYSAGHNMADSAKKGLSNAISKVKDYIDSDMDTQPTIRPVLDLSDVRNGANSINGLFSDNTLVGVRANVSGINSSMNNNIQNGGNNDIITAINKLRRDLGNVGNTVYNINGITYDDGSALQDAFGTIVRYARMERRV